MKLGLYTAIFHDRPLSAALDVVADVGLDGVELNTGGFLPPVHIPQINSILSSNAARDDFLEQFAAVDLEILGLNCNGNPLHPNPVIGAKHGLDVYRSIDLAHRLGQHRVVTMSGLPGGEPGASFPSWIVNAWNSAHLDVLDYQWAIAEKYWSDVDAYARDRDVFVALELHPQNIVFNPSSMRELVSRVGSTHLGVELDASHLFWQQMDPVQVVKNLGPLVVHAAAKDVRINAHVAVDGVLDNSFRRMLPEENRINLGGNEWVNEWPNPSSWDFVAVGRGHDVEFWAEFLRELCAVDPHMIVNIEHEDLELSPEQGVRVAAETLHRARELSGV